MSKEKIGIIMNGVTGRMGTNQHLLRSISKIIEQGGVEVEPGRFVIPDPILVGRNEEKLQSLCQRSGVNHYTTNVDEALENADIIVWLVLHKEFKTLKINKKIIQLDFVGLNSKYL